MREVATVDTNINATISAIKRAVEHSEQPQSEPKQKPVRLIDANAIKYTTMQIGHSHGAEPPETFAYKEDIDNLPTVDPESLELVQDLRRRLKSAEEISAKAISMLSRAEMEREAALNELDKLRREFERYKNRGLISRILNEEE